MKLQWIKNLPDYLPANEIKSYFEKILDVEVKDDLIDKEDVAEALWELSCRQWHTYEKIDSELKNKIERWLIDNFSGIYSRHFVELIGGIIGMLGLTNAYKYFQTVYNDTSLPQHIKQEFQNVTKEYGNSVDDPYNDMK